MANDTIQDYFQSIGNKFHIAPDTVRQIAYGEHPGGNETLVYKVLNEFVKHTQASDELIFAMVWEGKPIHSGVSNLPQYDWGGQVLEGINLKLYRTPYNIQVFFTNKIFANYAYYQHLLKVRPGAGFIVLQPGYMSELQAICNNNKLPILVLGPPADIDLDKTYTIHIDDEAAIRNSVKYIYGLGHRRIGFITGNLRHFAGTERLKGYYEGLKELELSLNEDWIFEGNWREDTGYAAATHFLKTETKPTAIVASNDQMAIGAIKCIQDDGLDVPRDVSVIGCNDIAGAIDVKPALTTIKIPMTQLGSKAAEYMITLLEGDEPASRNYIIPTELIVRKSTAPPA